MKDYYEILEVSRKASKDTINKIFKMHMKANHPDLFQGEEKLKAEEKSKILTEAYNVLSDDNERAKYDEQLKEQESLENSANEQLIQENEQLRKIIAQKDELLAKLTGTDFSQYNNYNNQYNEPVQNVTYGGFNGFTPQQQNPYEGMSLEELQNLKKEETKQYYISLLKSYGIKLLIFAIIIIAMLISIVSSFNDLNKLFK